MGMYIYIYATYCVYVGYNELRRASRKMPSVELMTLGN